MMKTQSTAVSKGSRSKKKAADINNITRGPVQDCQPKGEFLYDEILWPVLFPEAEQNTKMMRRIFDAVNQVSGLSSRLFVVRYDLHMCEYQNDNRVIDLFHRNLFRVLTKNYPKSFLSYVWVRERKISNAQHYHYALLMDGNFIRYPHKLTKIVQQCWHQVAGGSIVWVPDNCYYHIKKQDIDGYSQVMFRLSYFGKSDTKEPTSECKKRFGCGLRKPKKKEESQIATTVVTPVSDSVELSAVDLKTEVREENSEVSSNCCNDRLDTLFLGKTTLQSLKPPAMPEKSDVINELIKFPVNTYRQNQRKHWNWLFNDARPNWQWHRQNYLFEALSEGISLSAYAKKFKLKLRRVYTNFRRLGGQSLRMLHWAWHRRCYRQSQLSIDEYISRRGLKGISILRQLKRLPMSEYWHQHFNHYYQHFWPIGWTVSAYCEVHDVNASTARRYLIDFPKTCLLNPLILEPWL